MRAVLDDILQHEPLFAHANTLDVEPIQGGFVNHNYKIQADEHDYFLRINSPQYPYLQLDLAQEFHTIARAGAQQLAPTPVTYDATKGYLILEFLSCTPVTIQEFRDPTNLHRLYQKLKHLHQLEGVFRTCTPYHQIDRYMKGARECGMEIPAHFQPFLRRVNAIQEARSTDRVYTGRVCHHDFWPNNIVIHQHEYTLLDWEFCGRGDIFFDLATFPAIYAYTEAEEFAILTTYFDEHHNLDQHFELLQHMKFLSVVREVAWAYYYAGLNLHFEAHTTNYAQHAEFVLNILLDGKNSLGLTKDD